MLFPIKLKTKKEKQYIFENLKSDNVELRLNALNKIRIGKVFKTTNFNRIKLTTKYLKKNFTNFKNICDIGCSDGSSSLGLIKELDYNGYYCFDKFIKLKIVKKNYFHYLTDVNNNILMAENKLFYFYFDKGNYNKSFIENIFSFFFPDKIFGNSEHEINLINPEIFNYPKVLFKNFDVFKDNLEFKADLIIIFNLLDKFNDINYLRLFRQFAEKNINKGGLIVIGENNKIEKSSIYKFFNDFKKIKDINGGSIINFL
jgi:hypothetical protein